MKQRGVPKNNIVEYKSIAGKQVVLEESTTSKIEHMQKNIVAPVGIIFEFLLVLYSNKLNTVPR